jgi:hypothetical protein
MALTNAEKQAAWRTRREDRIKTLEQQVTELQAALGSQGGEPLRNSERERLEYLEALLESHKGVMPRETFNLIRACLHPDQSMSAEKTRKAFDAFSALEKVLCTEKPKPAQKRTSDLPSTPAEWAAARAQTQAKKKQKKQPKNNPKKIT